MSLAPKTVKHTAIEDQTYKIFPNDLNSHGTVFGGIVMGLADRTASVVAERHAEKVCVTALVDSMHFRAPASRGDILVIKAAINRAWTSSMEIGIKIFAEDYTTGQTKHILSAYFTFVAVDDAFKPTRVPPVIPETAEEQRRYEAAGLRRERRKASD